MLPPKRSTTESGTAVESRRNTEFTFIFSLKTSHGYGILVSRAFTEFWSNKINIESGSKLQKKEEEMI